MSIVLSGSSIPELDAKFQILDRLISDKVIDE